MAAFDAPGSPVAAASSGLNSAEAQRRLGEFGRNEVTEEATPVWRAYLGKLRSPVAWMLEAAIVLQIFLHEYVEAFIIGSLLLFDATLGFIQEGRANAALAALKNRVGVEGI